MSYLYQKCKNKWGHRLRFEDMIYESVAYFEKSALVIPLFLVQKCYERILGNKLALPKFIWVDVLSEYIPLLKSPEVNLILNNCISKLAELQSVRNSITRGVKKGEKHKLPTLIFCPYFDNWQKFVKEGDGSKKKVGVTDLIKRQNPREVVVLAKSATFAYKSSSVRALD